MRRPERAHAHRRWMRSTPSPSPGRRCHFYRDPLGQPDTVRARTASDGRHVSDKARWTLLNTNSHQPRSIRRVSGVRHCSGPHRVGLPCAACPTLRFLGIPRKRRFPKAWNNNYYNNYTSIFQNSTLSCGIYKLRNMYCCISIE